jgi:hypothetical protein
MVAKPTIQAPTVRDPANLKFTLSTPAACRATVSAPRYPNIPNDDNKENFDPVRRVYTNPHRSVAGVQTKKKDGSDQGRKHRLGGPLVDITAAYLSSCNRTPSVNVESSFAPSSGFVGFGWGGEVRSNETLIINGRRLRKIQSKWTISVASSAVKWITRPKNNKQLFCPWYFWFECRRD